ncbi:hypothetical protein B0T24DRAFT_527295 [Lasiosphaeria ovina]|uniref:tRNA-intron lyase n=1 Tax=Lasiosphaeria ovina TaxID=92902 RepID=A0AAE0KCD7_9PEZI|nr:hypothetical protein B0T24DRAFT_527295 [Lasiosphaeria ovina]
MPSSEEVPGHAVASALASDSAPAGSVATTKPLGTLTLASTTSESSTPTKIPLYKVYALPVPIRTFPLPAFYPSNPISLIHLVYAWLKQSISPPPAEPFIIHEGLWDPRTRSVHINDSKSIRALWEQGFFGKGSLSRSEPNWLKRELARRGSLGGKTVSEERTESRREERRLAKWERAKAELEVVERQRLEEAEAHITPAEEKPLPNGQLGTEEVVVPSGLTSLERAPLLNGEPSSQELPVSAATDLILQAEVESVPLKTTTNVVPESPRPPVGPAELLALPNSPQDLARYPTPATPKPPVGPADLLAFPNSLADLVSVPPLVVGVASSDPAPFHLPFVDVPSPQRDRQTDSKAVSDHAQLNGVSNGLNDHLGKASALDQDRDVLVDAQTNGAKVNGVTETANGIISHVPSLPSSVPMAEVITPQKARPLKRQKSVRFSPKVESTTFQHFDPPSPNRFTGTPPKRSNALNGGAMDAVPPAVPSPPAASAPPAPVAPTPLAEHNEAVSSLDFPVTVGELPNREHFQLSPEEAFFLAFVLGVLTVLDPATGAPIPTDQLLSLFRAYSYFPPKEISSSLDALQPSDPFLVNYVVYHHFRSLGWVPRHGIKFGVDFILYQRGPVFDHSEFGIIIMPSFSDPLWKEHEHDAATKSWSWLMGVNRVLAHVLKGLVLVYVDVPSPPVFDKAIKAGGLAAALKQYTIREVMVRRFSANRNR